MKKINCIFENAPGPGLRYTNVKTSFPIPVGTVIHLEANTEYRLTTAVDVEGCSFDYGAGNVMIGGGAFNIQSLKSTGLTTALFTGSGSLTLRDLSITAALVFDLDASGGSGTEELVWDRVKFIDCGSLGTIKAFSNAIWSKFLFRNNGPLVFDGAMGTIGIDGSFIVVDSAVTAITLAPTATISRRFRIDTSSFEANHADAVIIETSEATFPNQGFSLDDVNYQGIGTALVGVDADSNKALFTRNDGINNSSDVAEYHMTDNATVTVISATDTFTKILGATISDVANKFTNTDNRAAYIGALNARFKLTASGSAIGTNGQRISVRIARNDKDPDTFVTLSNSTGRATLNASTRPESFFCQGTFMLQELFETEIHVASETLQNVTIVDLNVIIHRLT